MDKTIWINGTERSVGSKDKYGMYHAFLDEKDIKWLNNINPLLAFLRTFKKDCHHKNCDNNNKGKCILDVDKYNICVSRTRSYS